MKSFEFVSKNSVYIGDYNSTLHSHQNEPTGCLHYHDFYELIVYLGQPGTFVIGESVYPIYYGDIVPVDMFLPHMLIPDPSDRYESFSAQVDPELLIAFSTPTANLLDIFKQGAQEPIHHIGQREFYKYQRLMDEYRAIRLEKGQEILIKAIIHQLMAYAYNDCYSGERSDEAHSQQLAIVTKLIHCINAHLTQKLTLEDLAEEVNYSTYYICHLFQRVTGRSISSYILEKRVEKVTGLLAAGTPAQKSAELAGFNNYSHFYRSFCRIMGCSPTEYAARLRRNDAGALDAETIQPGGSTEVN